MSSPIKLTPDEQVNLTSLPCPLRSLYVFGLRTRMDYRTGIVGLYGRLSYDRIRDVLDHDTLPGEQRNRPSRDFVKRALRRLEKQGLVVRCSRPRRLIVHLPLAEYDLRAVLEEQAEKGSLKAAEMASQAALQAALITPPRPPSLDVHRSLNLEASNKDGAPRPPSSTPLGRPTGRPPDPEDPVIDPGHTHARTRAHDGQPGAPSGSSDGVCVQGETDHEDPVRQVWEHWQSMMDAPGTVLDPHRRHSIERALGWGYTAAQLCEAVDGCRQSDWHMGRNDRGRSYNQVTTIFGDADRIERLRQPTQPSRKDGPMLHGFPKSELEARARPGEEYEHVAARLRAERDRQTSTTSRED